MTYEYSCKTHSITFITDGDFVITNNDIAASYTYTSGTIYSVQSFFCVCTLIVILNDITSLTPSTKI